VRPSPQAGVLEHALLYAARGWHVVPIIPGRKHPPMPNWQHEATTGSELIERWWIDRYRDHGIGIVTGPASGLWVLDVDTGDGRTGDISLAELELQHGALPATVEAITGTGGRHLYFAWDAEHPVRNDQSGRLGKNLDVRGDGGQVLAPPTIHPTTAVAYRWRPGYGPADIAVAPAPPTLLASLESEPPLPAIQRPPPRPASDDDDGPAAHFDAITSWPELLVRDGWTLAGQRGDEQRWTRPGKSPREGISATVGHNGQDCLKVFTSSVPELQADTAYGRFGYEAAMHWRGDQSALARHIRADMSPGSDDREDWSFLGSTLRSSNGQHPTSVGQQAPPAGKGLIVSSSIRAEPVGWLWEGRLPVGKLVVLDGDPDLGKSTLSLDLAARLSTGSAMPDGQLSVEACDTIVMSAEDGLADTIRPRLDAAGADCDRVHIWVEVPDVGRDGQPYTRPPSLPADVDRLEAHIRHVHARLVIVDVLAAYLASTVNAHQDQDVRRVLHALMIVAERTSSTMLVLRHLNKSGGGKALYRGGGSIGIVGAARVGLIVGRDPEDENRSVFAVAKCNLAARAKPLAYQIVGSPSGDCGCVRWLGETHFTADALMVGPKPEDDDEKPRMIAMSFLRQLLAEGPRPVQDIKAEATSAGITWRTLRRAQTDLGITPRKVGKPGDSEQWWEWGIPRSEGVQSAEGVLSGRLRTPSDIWPSSLPDDVTDSGQDGLGL